MTEQQQKDSIALVAGAEMRKTGAKQLVSVTPLHDGRVQVEVKGETTLYFDPRKCDILVRSMFIFHGIRARFMERSAVDADTKTGKTSSRLKWEKLKATVEHYEAGGAWELNAPSTAKDKGPELGMLMRAMIALGKFAATEDASADVDRFNVRLQALVDKNPGADRDLIVKRLWDSGDISAKVAELRARDKAAHVQPDDLLDAWDDEEDEQSE